MRGLAATVICLAVFCQAGPASSQQCDPVLKSGPFSEEKIKSNQEFANAFVDLVCNSQESSSKKSKDIGLKLPIGDLPIGAHYKNSDGTINKSTACVNKSNRSEGVILTDIFRRFADPNLLKTWLACSDAIIAAEATGLVCRMRSDDDDPEQIKITINWRPTNNSQNIVLYPSLANLECQNFQQGFEMKPYDARIILCSRAKTEKPASAAINSSAASSKCDLKVPAYKKETEPDRVEACFANIASSYPGGVAGNLKGMADQRCCQQMQIDKTDVTVNRLAQKQWGACIDLYNQGKEEIGDICVQANLPQNPMVGGQKWRVVAQRFLNEANTKLILSEENLGATTCVH